jgi:hypothetical protein
MRRLKKVFFDLNYVPDRLMGFFKLSAEKNGQITDSSKASASSWSVTLAYWMEYAALVGPSCL